MTFRKPWLDSLLAIIIFCMPLLLSALVTTVYLEPSWDTGWSWRQRFARDLLFTLALGLPQVLLAATMISLTVRGRVTVAGISRMLALLSICTAVIALVAYLQWPPLYSSLGLQRRCSGNCPQLLERFIVAAACAGIFGLASLLVFRFGPRLVAVTASISKPSLPLHSVRLLLLLLGVYLGLLVLWLIVMAALSGGGQSLVARIFDYRSILTFGETLFWPLSSDRFWRHGQVAFTGLVLAFAAFLVSIRMGVVSLRDVSAYALGIGLAMLAVGSISALGSDRHGFHAAVLVQSLPLIVAGCFGLWTAMRARSHSDACTPNV